MLNVYQNMISSYMRALSSPDGLRADWILHLLTITSLNKVVLGVDISVGLHTFLCMSWSRTAQLPSAFCDSYFVCKMTKKTVVKDTLLRYKDTNVSEPTCAQKWYKVSGFNNNQNLRTTKSLKPYKWHKTHWKKVNLICSLKMFSKHQVTFLLRMLIKNSCFLSVFCLKLWVQDE